MKHELRVLKRIKRDLKSLLKAAPTLQHAKGAGRIFELYVVMRVAKQLQLLGWTVTPLASDGTPLGAHRPFVQRGGAPSGIVPSAWLASGPSSIRIEKLGRNFEIWNGVQFRGRSGAKHELDISIVPSTLANALRAGSSEGFAFGRPPLAIECKDVGKSGSPDEMRSLVARMYDLTILESHLRYLKLNNGYIFDSPLGAHSSGVAPATYLKANLAFRAVLARRTGLSSGAADMTSLFNISPYVGVEHPSIGADLLVKETAAWIDAL